MVDCVNAGGVILKFSVIMIGCIAGDAGSVKMISNDFAIFA